MTHYDLMRPFSLLEGLDKDFDQLFYPKVGNSGWKPLSRVREEETHYHLALEIPGVDKENLKVELKDSILSINGERNDTFLNDNVRDKNTTHFEQHFSLPKDSNLSEIEVSQNNGILDIVIPKVNKKIEVKSFEIKTGKNVLIK
jgi:HSP20 family protein